MLPVGGVGKGTREIGSTESIPYHSRARFDPPLPQAPATTPAAAAALLFFFFLSRGDGEGNRGRNETLGD
jgi:hypothetical protein